MEHYKGCKKRLLVEWFAVGLELLVCTPVRTKVNVKGPAPHMVWGYVMFYENESQRYKILVMEQTPSSQARCWMISSSLMHFIIWSKNAKETHKSGIPKYSPQLRVMVLTACVVYCLHVSYRRTASLDMFSHPNCHQKSTRLQFVSYHTRSTLTAEKPQTTRASTMMTIFSKRTLTTHTHL